MADPVAEIAHSDPPEISARLWQDIPRGSVAWYVGANCGQNLGEFLSRFHHIYAFEPCQASFDRLVEVAARLPSGYGPAGGPRPVVDCLRLAVSSHDGSIELADLLGTRQHATGQLVTIGHPGMEWEPPSWGDRSKVRLVRSACRTLESLASALGDPEFISIDTEGHEWLILQASGDLLTVARPTFLIEFHSQSNHDNISRLLSGQGYVLETVRHPHYPLQSAMWYTHGWIKARYHLS